MKRPSDLPPSIVFVLIVSSNIAQLLVYHASIPLTTPIAVSISLVFAFVIAGFFWLFETGSHNYEYDCLARYGRSTAAATFAASMSVFRSSPYWPVAVTAEVLAACAALRFSFEAGFLCGELQGREHRPTLTLIAFIPWGFPLFLALIENGEFNWAYAAVGAWMLIEFILAGTLINWQWSARKPRATG